MPLTAAIQVRINEEDKIKADALFEKLGLDTPTAIRMFIKQAIEHNGLPFKVTSSVKVEEKIVKEKESIEKGTKPPGYAIDYSKLVEDNHAFIRGAEYYSNVGNRKEES